MFQNYFQRGLIYRNTDNPVTSIVLQNTYTKLILRLMTSWRILKGSKILFCETDSSKGDCDKVLEIVFVFIIFGVYTLDLFEGL